MKQIRNNNTLTIEQYHKCFDIVFSTIHSNGFKIDEMRDLLFDEDYTFLEIPNENWKIELKTYLHSIKYDMNELSTKRLNDLK